MGKDLLTVGFPNISKVSPNLRPIYENGIAEDEKAVRKLVNECNSSLSVSELPRQLDTYLSEHFSSRQCKQHPYQQTLQNQETSLRCDESGRQVDLNPSYAQTETPSTAQGSTVMIERNVVILGKVGTGKRTLGNHIVGKNIFQSKNVLAARNFDCHYNEQRTEDTIYRILTVDTESLEIGYCNPLPYIQERFQTVNLIIFVIANGRYTDESHRSLLHGVKSFYPRAKPFSTLVITHCEGITNGRKFPSAAADLLERGDAVGFLFLPPLGGDADRQRGVRAARRGGARAWCVGAAPLCRVATSPPALRGEKIPERCALFFWVFPLGGCDLGGGGG